MGWCRRRGVPGTFALPLCPEREQLSEWGREEGIAGGLRRAAFLTGELVAPRSDNGPALLCSEAELSVAGTAVEDSRGEGTHIRDGWSRGVGTYGQL